MHYIVNAKHANLQYQLCDATVSASRDGNRFYITLAPFGCGKSCDTPEAAIYNLLASNGCTSIQIRRAS